MSIPSISTRHKIYREALKDYTRYPYGGLCVELSCSVNSLGLFVSRDINDYPEINKHRPAGKKMINIGGINPIAI